MTPHGSAYGGSGPLLVGISWMELSLTTIVIAARTYTKLRLVPRGGRWALFWAIAAWVVGVFNCIAYTIAASFGIGNHESNLSQSDIPTAFLWVWVGNATTLISISFGKIAVVEYLLTIQGGTYRTKRYVLYFLGISTVLLNITTVLIIFNQCDPPRKLWHEDLPGNCRMRSVNNVIGTVCGAYGAFVDFAFAIYPTSLVYNLKIGKRLKLGISSLMAAGVFSGVCAVVKTVEVERVVAKDDATYVLTPLALWGGTEMWMVIIACSVPACWPLAVHLFRKAKSTASGNNNNNNNNSISKRHNYRASFGPDSYDYSNSGGSYTATAEGRRKMSREYPLLESGYGIMLRKDISVREEVDERETTNSPVPESWGPKKSLDVEGDEYAHSKGDGDGDGEATSTAERV